MSNEANNLPINQIVCGDCLEVMREWPDGCVGLVLTDPPYGIGLEYADYDDTEDAWYDLMLKLIPECKRLSSMSIMPTCRIKALQWIYANIPPDWLICWYKGSPRHRAYVGFNDWEPLMVYGKNHGVQMHDYFYCQPEYDKLGHLCPKPIKWALWFIERTTKSNDLILDPFCGYAGCAGTAKMLGRRYIGIDISEEYCQIARERLEAVDTGVPVKEARTGQMAMFNEAGAKAKDA